MQSIRVSTISVAIDIEIISIHPLILFAIGAICHVLLSASNGIGEVAAYFYRRRFCLLGGTETVTSTLC